MVLAAFLFGILIRKRSLKTIQKVINETNHYIYHSLVTITINTECMKNAVSRVTNQGKLLKVDHYGDLLCRRF